MCGFTGITLNQSKEMQTNYHNRFENAYKYIRKRGPDDKGIWFDNYSYFLHARLKIIDLRKISAQPMELGDNIICYNGEIYNFQYIRKKLQSKGHIFKTKGDTEVLLKAWMEWGVSMLPKLDGMFSFSIWNKKNKTLFLARDRFGKKPLVFSEGKNYLAFSSDIRSLAQVVESGGVNDLAIDSLFRFRFIREPMTIYNNFKKLAPGSFLIFNNYGTKIEKWYEFKKKKECYFNREVAIKTTKELVFKAVEKRLISDVPLGLFLSGGMDSGILLAVLSSLDKKIPTFTVGFSDNKDYYDESHHAARIANYFGSKHERIALSPQKVLTDIQEILDSSDEPFADSSAIAMFSISKIASESLKVALSGDGGDETFAGYRKYISYKWGPIINCIPYSIRKKIGKELSNKKKNKINDFSRRLRRLLTNYDKSMQTTQINFLDQLTEDEYSDLFGQKDNKEKNSFFASYQNLDDKINSMLIKEFNFSLLGDMLVKIDRYSMANSIEIRSPFLDKDLVEYAFSIPGKYKIGYFSGKTIIKDAFTSFIPKWHTKLPKRGFEIPLENWLKNDLKYLLEESTRKKVIDSLPFKNSNIIKIWKDEFLKGKSDNSWKLWTLISYFKWAEKNRLI